MKMAILMASYDDGDAPYATLELIRASAADLGALTVYLVDDGSRVPIDPQRIPASDAFTVVLARHTVNLGQGAALETARQLALRDGGFDLYVTMDADGQHRPEDLHRFVRAVAGGADAVFGNRFSGDSNVPTGRKALLKAAALFERILTGLPLKDAHNGFRAFSPAGIQAVRIEQERMAHATEIRQRVASVAHRLHVTEVPVSIRYTRQSMARGQRSLGALVILRDLFQKFLFGSSE